jgi:hypothetical protein
MAVKKIIDLEVQSNADEAVGSLRTQLRLAQQEVAALSEKFGATSKEAVEAAKRAAQLKDAIGDAKALTDAFNPDAKFKALTASLSGVAGGFSAVQGAMGLFGNESEELEKTLLKVQSAMALSQGLQALGESADSFKQLKAVALNALNSIKTAIGATGIGLLVVALGTVVAYWDDIAKAVGGATKETKAYEEANKEVSASLNKTYQSLNSVKMSIDNAKRGIISKDAALKEYNEKLGDALGKTDSLDVAEKRMADNTGRYIKAQIARANAAAFLAKASEAATKAATGEDMELDWWQTLKAQFFSVGSGVGLTAASVESATKSMSANAKKNAETQAFYSKLAEEETRKADAITTEINAAGNNKRYEEDKKNKEKSVEDAKKDKEKAAELEKQRQEEVKDLFFKFTDELRDMTAKTDAEKLELQKQNDLDEINRLAKTQDEKIGLMKLFNEKYDLLDKEETEKKRLKREEDAAHEFFVQKQLRDNLNQMIIESNDKMVEADLKMREARRFALDSSLELLSSFAGKNKALALGILAIQKGLAVADVIVNASKSIATQNANTFAANMVARATLGPIASEAVVAKNTIALVKGVATTKISAGVAIANILAQGITSAKGMLGGGGEGGGGAIGGGGGAAAQPQFNVVGNTGVNALADSLNKQPIQAYVVAQNVTSAQSMNRNIVQSATLG